MKQFRKFLLKFIIYLTDQHLLYEDMVLKKHIFPQKLDEQKLSYLLEHARNHVPIYKNLPLFKSYKDFSKNKFVLKKDLLKEDIWQAVDMHYSKKDILGKNPFLNMFKLLTDFLIPISTSGSTGKPLHFYKNKRTGLIALFSWMEAVAYLGWDEGASVMTCWQQGSYMKVGFPGFISKIIGINFFIFKRINKYSCRKFIRKYKLIKPEILQGFPSYLTEFANYIKENNIKLNHTPKLIVTCGEVLTKNHKELINSVFKTEIYDVYANSEAGALAVECKKHKGYHILEDHILLENGKDESILMTTLEQFDIPFIKYELGDRGKIVYGKCICGIVGHRINKIEGRTEDYFYNRKGEKIFASFLRQLTLKANAKFGDIIQTIQFVQSDKYSIKCKVKFSSDVKESIVKKFIRFTKAKIKLETQLDTNVSIVDELIQKKGKFKFLVREINQ